jgi:CheY-like chemotaxis protein
MVQRVLEKNSRNKLILVCDDIADNCVFLQTVLEIEGYEVQVVESGAAVLAFLESKTPDLLLLDVMMPNMNGYEVARRIQNNPILQFLPILLITADEQAFLRKESDVKVAGVIRKPVDPDALIEYVQTTLKQRQ